MKDQRVTFELVLSHLRKRDFAVLSTSSQEGRPHSAGVNYGVSRPGRGLVIYVMTRRHLRKARNIAQNPSVSLVVPLTRRLLWFLPPPTIQLHGQAEIVDWTDEEGTDVFGRFWIGRRILQAYQESHRRGETRICFLKITPDPVVYTYMVGHSIWQLRKRMESGAAKVVIPPSYGIRRGDRADALRTHGAGLVVGDLGELSLAGHAPWPGRLMTMAPGPQGPGGAARKNG